MRCSSHAPKHGSVLTIVRLMLTQMHVTAVAAVTAVIAVSEEIVPNWGGFRKGGG
jgi:hypothetical protein